MRTRLVLLSLLATPAIMEGQANADTGMVPRQLVQALFGTMGDVGITVGAPPQGFPAALLPRGSAVLGGVSHWNGRVLAVAVRTPIAGRAAIDTMRAMLLRTGWRQPEDPGSYRGGFVNTEARMGLEDHLCGADGVVNMGTSGRGSEGDLVVISYQPYLENTVCAPGLAEGFRGRRERVPLPSLAMPSTVHLETRGGGSGNDHTESQARATTSMAASALLDSLLPQLRDDGWTVVSNFGDVDAAIATARKTDDAERLNIARITVVRLASDLLDLTLNVTVPAMGRGSSRTTVRPGG